MDVIQKMAANVALTTQVNAVENVSLIQIVNVVENLNVMQIASSSNQILLLK